MRWMDETRRILSIRPNSGDDSEMNGIGVR